MTHDNQNIDRKRLPVSDRKLRSNCQNALKSTGPRTQQGRQIAARNALRHGLTSHTSVPTWHPQFRQLTDLIDEEIGDRHASEPIACNIIALERTLDVLQSVADPLTLGGGEREGQVRRAIKRDKALADDLLLGMAIPDDHERWSPKDRHLREFFIQRGHHFHKIAARQQKTLEEQALAEAVAIRRYFKRATNQFIKAVRSLSDRSPS